MMRLEKKFRRNISNLKHSWIVYGSDVESLHVELMIMKNVSRSLLKLSRNGICFVLITI